MRSYALFVLLAPTLLLSVACGSTSGPSSEFDPTQTGGGSILPPATELTLGGRLDGGNQGGNNGNDDGGACATTTTEAQLTPVDLVVMFDQSGSMGDTTENASYDPAKRWIPVKNAMKSFFSDAQSAGMRAQLSFFADAANSCSEGDYSTAEVPLTALPAAIFSTTLDAHAPKGDTPTTAAVTGAIQQAKATLAAHPTDKTVIVLVTDGEPYGCGYTTSAQAASEITKTSNAVAAVKSTIPTYVIGVGPSVSNLDTIATAGGTAAFHVDVGNPSTTTTQLLAAMAAIRGQLGRCDFDIPPPPDGRSLDFDKVNVEAVHAGAATETLAYNASCAGGTGWHFNDALNPKKVLLCATTCDGVKSEAGGKVNVSFACVNRPDVLH